MRSTIITLYTWSTPNGRKLSWQGIDLARYPAVRRWFEQIGGRRAVRRGMQVPAS